jgi:signal transduction histidine kinase
MRAEGRCRPSTGRIRLVLEQSSLRMTPDAARPVYPHGVISRFIVRVEHAAGQLSRGVWADLLLALGFMLAAGLEELFQRGDGSRGLSSAGLASLPLAALALRRSRPLLGLLLLVVAAASDSLARALLPALPAGATDVTVPILALLVMSYSLGVHGTGREVVLGIFQPLLLIVVIDLLGPGKHPLSSALPFFGVFIVGAPVLAGRLVRGRHALVVRLRRQEQEIDAERAAQTSDALAQERVTLTEKLHERLVAGMESVVAQAAAAQHSFEDARAKSVAAIEAQARDLLAETRRVVVSLSSNSPTEAMIHDQARTDFRLSRVVVALDARRNAALPWAAIAAATVCAGLLVEIGQSRHARVAMPIVLAACFIVAAPIALSWSRPLLMTAALWAIAAVFALLVAPLDATFTAISLSFLPPFAVAYFESRGRSIIGLGICGLGEVACFGINGWPGTVAILLLAWIGGRVLRDRAQLVEQLRANNILLAQERDSRLRSAVFEERARVARELHDAIGHSLTVIALHAGAARRMWTADRARAEAALRTISQVAVDGLTELRMGFSSSRVAARTGSPTTEPPHNVEELVWQARGTGLSISLCIDKPAAPLSPETELEAFRVLQEALTNVLKHAPGASAEVTVRNAGPDVELVVANSTGTRQPAPSAGSGRGLRGMRERAEACGGRLDWSRREDGGFEVRARFPALPVEV